MVSNHCIQRIKEREINIDLEMIEFRVSKSNGNSVAFILGEVDFLGDENYVILIVRNNQAVTIEFRRKSQTITAHALNVDTVSKYPCLF